MPDPKQGPERSMTTWQLRGGLLQQRIEAVMRELAAKAQKAGTEYVYNASEMARRVPTTRKSLAKHGELVARVLQDLNSRRRMATGEATAEHLRDQIAYLKEQLESRNKVIAGLRAHHVEIYRRFHEHSLDAELLIRPILLVESVEAGECILCRTKVDSIGKLERSGNVVRMERR